MLAIKNIFVISNLENILPLFFFCGGIYAHEMPQLMIPVCSFGKIDNNHRETFRENCLLTRLDNLALARWEFWQLSSAETKDLWSLCFDGPLKFVEKGCTIYCFFSTKTLRKFYLMYILTSFVILVWVYSFSLHQPSGPIQSLSCDVWQCVCLCYFLQFFPRSL